MLPFLLLLACLVILIFDYALLFCSPGGKIDGERDCASRFSNGDENPVRITLTNQYSFQVHIGMIDEIPFQFQKRDLYFLLELKAGETRQHTYMLRPVKRGVYGFGCVRVYVTSRLGWVQRRFKLAGDEDIKVYPSYLQLRKYQLMAETNRWSDAGIRRKRQLGHSMEFEQIMEYVPGDDYRTINWKATARSGNWKVNNYIEEKSQQVYCVIDKGRTMRMPFEGLSLLDYAINASLVLTSVALKRQDKAGLVTFSDRMGTFLGADKKGMQMQTILEALYHQKTSYQESDFERLYITLRKNIPQRSLLVLFTNFETLSALRRQEPYLKKMAVYHLLLVVVFENTEIRQMVHEAPRNIEGVYTQVIAEKFTFEKRQVVRELQRWGIAALLTTPDKVTVNSLNKYLELKARQAI